MKRLVLPAIIAAALPAPAAEAFTEGCKSTSCHKRVTKKWGHKQARKMKRRTIAPHVGFLAKLRACEVNGQPQPYRTNTGNGFFGAYQFTVQSWYAVGGRGMPHQATPLEQDFRAVRLLNLQGPGAWPVCSR